MSNVFRNLTRRAALALLAPPTLLAAPVAACRTAPHASAAAATAAHPRVRRKADVITLEEIGVGQWGTAYDMVASLRPLWMHSRGRDTIYGQPPAVQVRVDDQWFGGLAALRDVSVSDVAAAHFVDPITAANLWGGSHRDGAIVISTRR